MTRLLCAITVLSLAGCANPLNRATHDRYWEDGRLAERNGNLGVAEQAYYRALVNDDIGNLGPLLKAQDLYNLGRIKRRLHKFSEAEDLLKQSLILDQKILSADNLDTDRCRVELSVALAARGKWDEGSRVLEPELSRVGQFSGGERDFLLETFRVYGVGLRKAGLEERAKLFDL